MVSTCCVLIKQLDSLRQHQFDLMLAHHIEPIYLPKLQIQFADFPKRSKKMCYRFKQWTPDAVICTAILFDCFIFTLDFQLAHSMSMYNTILLNLHSVEKSQQLKTIRASTRFVTVNNIMLNIFLHTTDSYSSLNDSRATIILLTHITIFITSTKIWEIYHNHSHK